MVDTSRHRVDYPPRILIHASMTCVSHLPNTHQFPGKHWFLQFRVKAYVQLMPPFPRSLWFFRNLVQEMEFTGRIWSKSWNRNLHNDLPDHHALHALTTPSFNRSCPTPIRWCS